MLIVVRDNDKKLIKKGWKTLIVSRECEFCSVFSMCRSNIRNIIKTWVLLVIIHGVDAVSNYAWKLFVLLTYFFFSSSLFYSFSQFLSCSFLDFHYWFPTSRIVCLLTNVSFAFRQIFEPRCNLLCNRIRDGVLIKELREKKSFPRGKSTFRMVGTII